MKQAEVAQLLLTRFRGWEAWLQENDDYQTITSSFTHTVRLPPKTGTRPVDRLRLLEIFAAWVEAGTFPPGPVLIEVSRCFRHYLAASGDITLDEAFDFRSAPRAGNPSKQAATRRALRDILSRIARYRVDHGVSLEKAIAHVKSDPTIPYEDTTLVSYYKRRGGIALEKDYRALTATMRRGK